MCVGVVSASVLKSGNLPEKIGRYQVVGHLATGGMAEVFLGKLVGPSGFQRPVVIKRILPHLAREPSFVRMFLDEARIVAGIRHNNVVQVHELGQDGDQLFLAMEWLEGESTDGLLRRLASRSERLDWGLCAHVIAEACAGLHAAHELTDIDGRKQLLVHRDVSPQNIFLTYGGEVKVLDFGIAKVADRESKTEAGFMKGKYAYMAPEQVRGEPLDRRCDVFALGIVLYELSTCRRLFARKSQLEVMKAICEEPLVPPSRVIAGYPPWLEQIVLKALARDRTARYETAAEMRRYLLAAIRMLGLTDARDEALSSEMHRLFADRISEKREMLRRVRSGVDLTHVPSAELSTPVEIPVVIDMNDASVVETPLSVEVPSSVVAELRPLVRRGPAPWMLAAGAAFLLAAGGVVWWSTKGGSLEAQHRRVGTAPDPADVERAPPLAPRVEATAPVSAAAPSAPTPETGATPTPPAEVTVRIQTAPAGATVLVGGEEKGQTPFDLRLQRGETPVQVTLRLAGHRDRVESVQPDVDQRLHFDLERVRAAHPGKAPGSAEPPPPQGRGFFRYD